MSKAPFAALTDGEHYHQPRSSVLGCSSWGRIRRRRAISINAARTILPLWQLAHDGCLEVVENTPTPGSAMTFRTATTESQRLLTAKRFVIHCLNNSKNLEATVRALQNKIVTLTKRSNFLCRKITGRPALSLLLFQTLHRNATRAQPFFRNCQSQPRPVYT